MGTLILLVAYILTTLGAIRLLFVQRKMPVPMWQVIIPIIALVVLGYTIYRNVSRTRPRVTASVLVPDRRRGLDRARACWPCSPRRARRPGSALGWPATRASPPRRRAPGKRSHWPMPDVLDGVALVDHHCHGVRTARLDRAAFEADLTEAAGTGRWHGSLFDTQAGLAVRRWCAPLLDLPAHAPAEDYLDRRAELGVDEVNRRLLASTGTAVFLVDTGYLPEALTPPGELAALAGGTGLEIVRLEHVAESVIGAADYADAFGRALAARADAADRLVQVDRRIPLRARSRSRAPVRRRGTPRRRRVGPRRRGPPTAAARSGPASGSDLDRPRARAAACSSTSATATPTSTCCRCDPLLLTPLLRARPARGAGDVAAQLPVPPACRLPGAGVRPCLRRRRARAAQRRQPRAARARRAARAGAVRHPCCSAPTPSRCRSCTSSRRRCSAVPGSASSTRCRATVRGRPETRNGSPSCLRGQCPARIPDAVTGGPTGRHPP